MTEAVCEYLCRDQEPQLVGLVGGSGSGKTTAASEIIRSTRVREFFDGVLWLSVDQGACDRVPLLMQHLAKALHQDVRGSVGRPPAGADDGVAYVRKLVQGGNGGRGGLRCLVVADNVWEREVLWTLRDSGVWVLVTTRDETIVTEAAGEPVVIDQLSEEDARTVLAGASELPAGARLPDAATDVVDLCGRLAIHLAFVGRWSCVRGSQDPQAWSNAVVRIRAELEPTLADTGNGRGEGVVTIQNGGGEGAVTIQKKAVLRAGFQDLAVGTDDERVPWLYLALSILPDSYAFDSTDAGVLLFGPPCTFDDKVAAQEVLETLERWDVLTLAGGRYRMHDAHTAFARENFLIRGDVRLLAVRRWVNNISSLDAVRSMDGFLVQKLWEAVERVGGGGWRAIHPYRRALDRMSDSDPLCRQTLEAAARFHSLQGDWEGEKALWHRLLEVERTSLGADHPYVVGTLSDMASCAERMGKANEADEFRQREREVLRSALARIRSQGGFAECKEINTNVLMTLTASMVRLLPGDGWGHAEKMWRRALDIEVAREGPDSVRVASLLHDLGACVQQAGQRDEAARCFRRSLEIKEARLGPEDFAVAGTLCELGVCLMGAARREEAEPLLRRALRIQQAHEGADDLRVAYTLHQLGMCMRGPDRREEAQQLFSSALGIQEAAFGPDDVRVAAALHQLGLCVRRSGRHDEAETLLRRSLSILEAKLEPDDVRVALALYHLGVCVLKAGRGIDAEGLLRRALEIQDDKLGPYDVRVANTLNQLGACIRSSDGRHAESAECFTRALRIQEQNLGPDHLRVAYTLHELGLCLREAGRHADAEACLKRALEIKEARLGPGDVQVAYTLHALAACARDEGRYIEEEIYLRRALDIKRLALGEDNEHVAAAAEELGICVREADMTE